MSPQYIADPPRKRPLRNMNDESTKKGFGLVKIDALQDVKDFLTTCTLALMQHTNNTTYRALINSMELHDVSLPICDMMSLCDNKRIVSCVLRTSSSLYPKMKIILVSLPPLVYLMLTMLSVSFVPSLHGQRPFTHCVCSVSCIMYIFCIDFLARFSGRLRPSFGTGNSVSLRCTGRGHQSLRSKKFLWTSSSIVMRR